MLVVIWFLFGLLIGSFLNVCIHRWPPEESVVSPRSYCPKCKRTISWFDNIPVFSYILLRGRCRGCAESISPRYPLVEILNPVLFALIVGRFGLTADSAKMMLFASMMIVLFFTDIAEYILPDEITIGGTVIGFLLSPFLLLEDGLSSILFFFLGRNPEAWARSLTESVLGAVLFGGVLFVIGEIYFRVRDIDGLGLGDVKMVAMIAAFWGVPQTMFVLILGSIVAAIVGVLLIVVAKKDWKYALPFGSYLAAAAVLAMFWSQGILTWYWNQVAG